MRLARILAVFLCAATLAFAASGCGSGSKSYSGAKPEAWATTVCGALSDWVTGLQSGSTSLSSDLGNAKDVQTVKDRFIVFLKDAERSSGVMLAKVKAAGPPAVKDGAAIQGDLELGLTRAQSSFTRAVARAERLPTNNPQAFSVAVQALGKDVEKELTATGGDFNKLSTKYKDKTLDEATAKVPACTKLSGG